MKTTTFPKVLLVEDDPISGVTLSTCIQQAGCTPIGPVSSATEALSLFNLINPQALIIDLDLHGVDNGIEFARMVRQLNPATPILFVTADHSQETFEQAQEVGPVAFFLKPFDCLTLQRALLLAIQHAVEALPLALAPAVPIIDHNGVFVREGSRLTRLSPDTIACVQMDERYCVIVTVAGRRHSVRAPLRELLRYLHPAELARVHRSWLVNVVHIEHINVAEGTIKLTGGTEAPLSRGYREVLFQQVRLLE